MRLKNFVGALALSSVLSFSPTSAQEYDSLVMQDEICYSVRDEIVGIRSTDNEDKFDFQIKSAYGNPFDPNNPRVVGKDCKYVRGSVELCIPAEITPRSEMQRRFRGERFENFEPNIFPRKLENLLLTNHEEIYEKDKLCYKVKCDDSSFPFPEYYDQIETKDMNGIRDFSVRRVSRVCTPARRSLFDVTESYPTGTVKRVIANPDLIGVSPTSLAINSVGERLVLTETPGGIFVFDPSYNFIKKIGEDILSRDSYGIALDSDDNIYVADSGNNRVTSFNKNGELRRYYDGMFVDPYRLDVDALGNLWIADYGSLEILKLNNEGEVLKRFNTYVEGNDEPFPRGIALDESLNRIYVTREGDLISIYNMVTGRHVGRLSPSLGDFDSAVADINVDRKGFVFLYGYDQNLMYIFDNRGKEVARFGGRGRDPGKFDGWLGIDFNSQGDIITVDSNSRFQVFHRGYQLGEYP